MQISPLSQQKFEGAKFFKIPEQMQEVMLKDVSFNRLVQDYDIFVSASPKKTWKDPFGLRMPASDEKCRLSCEMHNLDDDSENLLVHVTTKSKFVAPLREHVNTLLKQLQEFDFTTRVNRLVYGLEE